MKRTGADATSFEFEGERFHARTDETLLDALLRQGAEVAHSCRRGSCRTCALRAESGSVRDAGSGQQAIAGDCILPCVSRVDSPGLRLRRPRPGEFGIDAELVARRELAPGLFALDIAPTRSFEHRAGQCLAVEAPDGTRRPYSIASRSSDAWFLTIHVRELAHGHVSGWLCRGLAPGDRLVIQGPFGDCAYDGAMQDRPLRLLATGAGAGAMAALAREAIALGHRGDVVLYHGVRRAAELHLDGELRELARGSPQFHYRPCLSRESGGDAGAQGRVVDRAFDHDGVPPGAELFLCGRPEMVEEARYRARLAGIPAARVHADAFVTAGMRAPRDAEKLASIRPDPELWQALGQGPGLTRILEAFYARVFADPRLAPFFHQVTRERAITKQYEFLASLFTGSGDYFGLNPYNAHHWMVISDELFDHREAMFESVLRESGLAPHLVDRWLALHELFRAELVKPAARGLVCQGVEQPLRHQSTERLEIDAVCDACGGEIPAGAASRYLFRIGALHCAGCAGIGAGDC